MKPNILDPRWKYTPSSRTDIRVSIRRAQREIDERRKREQAETARVVKPLIRSKP